MEKINMRQYFDDESCAYTYLLFNPYKKSIIIDSVLEQFERNTGIVKNWIWI